MNDGLEITIGAPQPISDPVAFSHLGVDPAGSLTYTGNNQFNYFPPDWKNIDTPVEELSDTQHFNDPALREKLGLPAPEDEETEEPLTATWTNTPRELIRDDATPIVLSTTPDVAKTPMGSSTPPIPYSTYANPANDSGYTGTVFATQFKVMVLRSDITVTHGAEPGTANGVKSGTINDITEPMEHSTNVRAEGSPVIRHLDRAYMNNRNNIGEFIYVEDVSTRPVNADQKPPDPEPEEEPGFFGWLWEGAKEINEEYSVLERGVGALQVVGGAVEMVGGAAVVLGSGVGTVFSGGTATPLMVVTAAGGGALAAKGGDDAWSGLRTIWTGEIHDTYLDQGVTAIGESVGASDGAISVAQGIAGAVGNPANIAKEGAERAVREGAEEAAERAARETAEEVAEEGAERAAREGAEEASEETAQRNARITPKQHRVRCFNRPDGIADDIFEAQLREQEAVLNSMSADLLVARRNAIQSAGGTRALRDAGAQQAARTQYLNQMTRHYRRQGNSQSRAAELAKADATGLHATHRLDIIAGGDPSDISGLQDGRTNSSLGSQWKGSRSQSVEDYAREMQKNGNGNKKMRLKLEKC